MSVYIPYDEVEIANFYEWAVGESFTPCSQTCGRGIQSHFVKAVIPEFL